MNKTFKYWLKKKKEIFLEFGVKYRTSYSYGFKLFFLSLKYAKKIRSKKKSVIRMSQFELSEKKKERKKEPSTLTTWLG